ncbi:hypothetical protein INT47_001446 [Mucor saturninus]|uniref:Glutaminyl-tRNA synthetase class Ib non-specific RNA-binding domain-containing protein n=1 Tax=Mucor saturninus TaxID=64648 RepID=A0A8H7R107_9FUNG|nr:hypothetical protein INT47_001446 [Mucor saturninus]
MRIKIGITVAFEQITAAITSDINTNYKNIVANRYKTLGLTLGNVLKIKPLRWTDGGKGVYKSEYTC